MQELVLAVLAFCLQIKKKKGHTGANLHHETEKKAYS